MLRLQLPFELLRGQTYDGASNMSGIYKGCQSLISQIQPLATYVHCSAHCTNLVALAAVSSSSMIAGSIQVVNDFGVLCSSSGKFKSLFAKISADSEQPVNFHHIKPLCPTRWLVRVQAIQAAVEQYKIILNTLEVESVSSDQISVRASGLLDKFQDGATLMCLIIAGHVLGPLECLNRALQSSTMTVPGMLESTKAVKTHLISLRNDKEFDDIITDVELKVKELDLEPLTLPRRKNLPKRLSGPAEAYNPATVVEHFRIEYFKMLDATIQQLSDIILDCPGMRRFHELEAILLTGEVTSIASEYPELCDQQSLKTELAIFLKLPQEANVTKSLAGSATSLRNMVPEMRMMFPHVEALVRLLMVNPASSASAERSFSSLRRLKTYLR